MKVWTYDELKTNATLIVIATPVLVMITGERTNLAGSHVEGTGVETSFSVLAVFKGDYGTNVLVLHHYTVGQRGRNGSIFSDSDPRLVSFEPKDKKRYLMFLKKEADGRYIPVSGQYDPVDSIELLSGGLKSAKQPGERDSPRGIPLLR